MENEVYYDWIEIHTSDGAAYPFAIDPASYIKRDIIDFAPRSGGGDVVYSNLDLYQLVTQDSWHHGLGFIQFRDKFGYRVEGNSERGGHTDYHKGGVDARHVGMAVMSTALAYESGGIAATQKVSMRRCVDFNGDTYFNCGSNGILKRELVGTWSKVLSANVVDLKSNGSYLIATISSGRMQTSSNGTTWVDAGVGGNPPNNFGYLEMHNGFMWASESSVSTSSLSGTNYGAGTVVSGNRTTVTGWTGTLFRTELAPGDIVKVGSTVTIRVENVVNDNVFVGTVLVGGTEAFLDTYTKITYGANYNVVHFWASSDSSDAEGGGATDISAIQVGVGSYAIKGLRSFNGSLYVARQDGVWAIDETVQPPLARRVLDFSDEQDTTNFDIFITWRGRLYFNIKNALYAYNGASLANVSPPTYDLGFPPQSFGGYVGAVERGPYMYFLAKSNNPGLYYYYYALLAFDGTGWFRLEEPHLANTGVQLTGIGYSSLSDRIYIGCSVGNDPNFPGGIQDFIFQSLSDLPYARFDTEVEHYLNLSEIDFGFRRVVKSFAEIDLEVYNVAAGRYVSAEYSADKGAWSVLGYTQTSGVTKLLFNPTVQANILDVRLNFQSSDSAQTPVLRNFSIKAMIRPDVLYGHQMVVIGGNELRSLDGRFFPGSSEEHRQHLEAVRNSKAPITFIDPFGQSHTGYVSTSQFREILRRPGERQSNWSCILNVVEVR